MANSETAPIGTTLRDCEFEVPPPGPGLETVTFSAVGFANEATARHRELGCLPQRSNSQPLPDRSCLEKLLAASDS